MEKHGGSHSRTYRIWISMRARCSDKNHSSFRYYGGRGITVCERWQSSFTNFLEDMGEPPTSKHSIDRFPDKNGNYEHANCRWATQQEQNRNTTSNRTATLNGETLCLAEWSDRIGISDDCIADRIDRGWEIADALSPNRRWSPREITFQGVTQSFAAWERETGISCVTLKQRINKLKWSVKDALTIPPKRGQRVSDTDPATRANARLLTHNGVTQTMSDWSRVTGIAIDTIFGRLKRGWSDERTLTYPLRSLKVSKGS